MYSLSMSSLRGGGEREKRWCGGEEGISLSPHPRGPQGVKCLVLPQLPFLRGEMKYEEEEREREEEEEEKDDKGRNGKVALHTGRRRFGFHEMRAEEMPCN